MNTLRLRIQRRVRYTLAAIFGVGAVECVAEGASTNGLAFVLLVLSVACWLVARRGQFLPSASLGELLSQCRASAERELAAVKVANDDTELRLDAAQAEVVDQSESFESEAGVVDAYYLTQIVRNPAGEYFLLKTTDCRPYIKHLTQDRARTVLKSKYRAPDTTLQQPSNDA